MSKTVFSILCTTISFLSLICSTEASACSIYGADLFKPTLVRWEQHPGPKQKDPNSQGDYWERVPTPIVEVISVKRGRAASGFSCDDAGTIELQISLPDTSTYNIEEFGFYFRVLSDVYGKDIFPNVPLYPLNDKIADNSARLIFPWLDGHPRQQAPLDMTVEIFLVTNGLDIGQSTKLVIKAPTGKH